MPVASKAPTGDRATAYPPGKPLAIDQSSSSFASSQDSDSSSENGDRTLSAMDGRDTPTGRNTPTDGLDMNDDPLDPNSDVKRIPAKIETSPHADLNKALRAKNESERESFMLLLKDNVGLKTSNDELKKQHSEVKSEIKKLQQTNEALLNNNEVLMQQVKDIKKQMKDIMEAALKAKERTEAQLAISNEDKVHLDVWPDESPAGKLWYDKKLVDLHDKVKLLSDDIEKSDDDYNKVKKDLDNQLFLNKKYKEKLTDSQIVTLNEEIGDLDKLGGSSESSGSRVTLTQPTLDSLPSENVTSKTCAIM